MQQEIPKIKHMLARVRYRIRFQSTVDALSLSAIPAMLFLLVGLVYLQMDFAVKWAYILIASSILVVCVGVLLGLLWPIPTARVTRLVDKKQKTHDRFSIALSLFANVSPTVFALAAIRDAEKSAARVNPKHVVQFRRPPGFSAVLVLSMAFAFVPFIEPLAGMLPVHKVSKKQKKTDLLKLSKEELALYREKEKTRKWLQETQDKSIKKQLEKLERLWDALQKGTLSRQAFYKQLAKLQLALKKASEKGKGSAELQKIVNKILNTIKKNKKNPSLKKALKGYKTTPKSKPPKTAKNNSSKMANKLSHLLRKLASTSPQLGRHFTKIARSVRKKSVLPWKRKNKPSKKGHSTKTKKLIQKLKSLLNQLRRQKSLNHLRDQLDRMRLALDQKRIGGKQRSLQLKRFMARAKGQPLKKPGKSPKLGKTSRTQYPNTSQRPSTSRTPSGKISKGTKQPNITGTAPKIRPDRFPRMPKDPGRRPGKSPKMGRLKLPGGTCNKPGNKPGGRKSGLGNGLRVPGRKPGGNKAGKQVDMRLSKKSLSTYRRVDHHDSRLTGKKGKGPSRSQVILDASSSGFAKRSYRKVFQSYFGITNEDMVDKKVPRTYREMVRRYFIMIKPR